MYRRILVAFDGSPESRVAVDECSHLMQVSGREIHLVCVLHDPSPYLLAGEFVPERRSRSTARGWRPISRRPRPS